jgi:galactose-1-phosphate uridylyltransferase
MSGDREHRVVPREWLDAMTEVPDAGLARYEDLVASVRGDPGIPAHRPLPIAAIDPRTGERVVFCVARARRPHDHDLPVPPPDPGFCLVCEGKTTSILDRAPLTGGDETFVNKNLFPLAYPEEAGAEASERNPGEPSTGLHFLQWTSTRHDRDLDTMPAADVAILLERLGRLEATCLHDSAGAMPPVPDRTGTTHHGYFTVIKNVGRMVGGSLVHGHQQMAHTSIRPRRVEENAVFLEGRGEPFARHLLRENPARLTVREYEGGARLVVPWFMRRPLDMILMLDGEEREHLHELTATERLSLGTGLGDMCRAVGDLMPKLGREVAYNLVFHTGPVGALYVEMLPYTQERGGYESAGIVICQGEPFGTAALIREALDASCPRGRPAQG